MIKKKIKSIMQNIFELDIVPDDISQDDYAKWDSLKHLALAVAVEEAFDISLEPGEIEQMTSLREIEIIIESKN